MTRHHVRAIDILSRCSRGDRTILLAVAFTAKTVIERNQLFRGLAQATIERIAALATRKTYADGTVVFMRGDPGDSLCGVVSGRVRISASRPGGREVFLNIMEPGDAFGEIGLLDGKPRTATATTLARTELIILRRDRFISLLGTEPSLAAHLIQLLCERVRWTSQLMEDSALLGVPARIAKRLLSLARVHGGDLVDGTKLTISQEELAQFLGVSRQVVNQHLQAWKQAGWVSSGRGSITLADVRSLHKVSQGV
jgi:CRP/FNR family cyclic AMP-dependent transcriptional regulator